MKNVPKRAALYDATVDATKKQEIYDLARGYLRYEALRKLNAREYAELMERNRRGERFDDMVDELILKGKA